jgi:hypothetical protein
VEKLKSASEGELWTCGDEQISPRSIERSADDYSGRPTVWNRSEELRLSGKSNIAFTGLIKRRGAKDWGVRVSYEFGSDGAGQSFEIAWLN